MTNDPHQKLSDLAAAFPAGQNPKVNSLDRRLESIVEAYEKTVDDQGTADVVEFLPDEDDDDYQWIGIELLCVDMQFGWQRSQPRALSEYQHAFPQILSDLQHLSELAFEEYRMRRLAGQSASPEEYTQKYAINTDRWPRGDDSTVRLHGQHDSTFAETRDALSEREISSPWPAPGESILNFQLVREIGRGAFARVYLAQQNDLAGRHVVLKVTKGGTLEPQYLARLQHTHIVPIHSVHRHEEFQVVCMPFFGETTLADPLSDGSHLEFGTAATPFNAAAQIASQIASALQHAHQQNTIHRDLKPANILLSDHGPAMLLDFNLADEVHDDATHRSIVGGTLPYLSAEHIQSLITGTAVAATDDVYSLGVILYQMLTGELPYTQHRQHGDTGLQQMIVDRQMPAKSPSAHDPRIPPSLGAIAEKAIAVRPDARYQSAQQMRQDLQSFLNDQPLKHAGNPSIVENTQKWARRHPRLSSSSVVGILALFLLLGSMLAIISLRTRSTRSQARLAIAALVDELPHTRALLSIPETDASTLTHAIQRASESLQPTTEIVELDKLVRHPAGLTATEHQRWQRVAREQLYLMASGNLQLARTTSVATDASQFLARARELNRCARSVSLTDSPSLQQQHLAIESAADQSEPVSFEPITLLDAADVDDSLIALALLQNREYSRALPLLRLLRDERPFDASAWFLLGKAYAGTQQFDAAEGCFTTGIAMWPESIASLFQRGLCRIDQNNPQAAIEDFSRVLRDEPNFVSALINRAVAYRNADQLEAAERDLDKAIGHGATQTRVFFIRSEIRNKLGRRDDAKADFEKGLQTTPVDARSWSRRGHAWLSLRQFDKALQDFDAALKIDPTSYTALRNTAFIYGEQYLQLDKAIETVDQLVEFYPHRPTEWISRAVYHARLGNRNAAIADSAKALELESSDKVLFQAGCVYALLAAHDGAAVEDVGRAIELVKAAIEKQPSWKAVAKRDSDLDRLRQEADFQKLLD